MFFNKITPNNSLSHTAVPSVPFDEINLKISE